VLGQIDPADLLLLRDPRPMIALITRAMIAVTTSE
jgi:hypothetical protein